MICHSDSYVPCTVLNIYSNIILWKTFKFVFKSQKNDKSHWIVNRDGFWYTIWLCLEHHEFNITLCILNCIIAKNLTIFISICINFMCKGQYSACRVVQESSAILIYYLKEDFWDLVLQEVISSWYIKIIIIFFIWQRHHVCLLIYILYKWTLSEVRLLWLKYDHNKVLFYCEFSCDWCAGLIPQRK